MLHRGRTSDSRRTMANSHHRRVAGAHRTAGSAGVSSDARDHDETRRFAAKRYCSGSSAASSKQRSPGKVGVKARNQSGRSAAGAIRRTIMNQGGGMKAYPRSHELGAAFGGAA